MDGITVLTGAISAYAQDAGNPNNTISLTADRYYPGKLPNDPIFPAVVLLEPSSSPDLLAHSGNRVFTGIRVQFDVYAASLGAAGAIAERLFDSFSGLSNTTIGSSNPNGGVFVKSAFRQLKFHEFNDELDCWRYVQDFIFNV